MHDLFRVVRYTSPVKIIAVTITKSNQFIEPKRAKYRYRLHVWARRPHLQISEKNRTKTLTKLLDTYSCRFLSPGIFKPLPSRRGSGGGAAREEDDESPPDLFPTSKEPPWGSHFMQFPEGGRPKIHTWHTEPHSFSAASSSQGLPRRVCSPCVWPILIFFVFLLGSQYRSI